MAIWIAGDGHPATSIVAGLVVGAWGIAVGANIRGLADLMPRRWGVGPFTQDVSPAMLRLIFTFFAIWGALACWTGLYHAFR